MRHRAQPATRNRRRGEAVYWSPVLSEPKKLSWLTHLVVIEKRNGLWYVWLPAANVGMTHGSWQEAADWARIQPAAYRSHYQYLIGARDELAHLSGAYEVTTSTKEQPR